jgi:UDP-N-acetylmuramoylalanine--D-glutamate ligase
MNVLVVGLGVSGIACIKGLSRTGAKIYAFDESSKENLKDRLKEVEGIEVEYFFGNEEIEKINIKALDYAIKSPGIKYEVPIIEKLLKNNIEVISDIEAAYRVTNASIVSISGTNGKTTTTTLIGEMVRESGKPHKVTGNIGFGIYYDALNAKKEDILVAEVSSFQLAGTIKYKPHISVLTNITPDHLDYHHTVENYIETKFKNVITQDENDYAILNYEDNIIRNYSDNIKAKKIFFSSERVLEDGIFAENGQMFYRTGNNKEFIINTKEIFIPGKHNLENAMAACGAAIALGIDAEVIAKVLREFKGVEHRLEFTGEYNKVKFYNDSKGTNPDASIKAVQGIDKPIILIAGGYDKQSDYDELIKAFDNKVKALILLGQTAEDIERCALKNQHQAVETVEDGAKLLLQCGKARLIKRLVLCRERAGNSFLFGESSNQGR